MNTIVDIAEARFELSYIEAERFKNFVKEIEASRDKKSKWALDAPIPEAYDPVALFKYLGQAATDQDYLGGHQRYYMEDFINVFDNKAIGRNKFKQEIAKARQCLVQAYALHPEYPEAASNMIRVAMAIPGDVSIKQWFHRTILRRAAK